MGIDIIVPWFHCFCFTDIVMERLRICGPSSDEFSPMLSCPFMAGSHKVEAN
jgi:hypothetical protein